jgi:hypothetical protein
MTDFETLFLLLALVAGGSFVVAGIKVHAFQSPTVWTQAQLKRKRTTHFVGSCVLLVLSGIILGACRDDINLLFAAIACIPIAALGFMNVWKISKLLNQDQGEPPLG